MNERALGCLIIALMMYRGWSEAEVSQLLALMVSIHEEETNLFEPLPETPPDVAAGCIGMVAVVYSWYNIIIILMRG